MKATENGTHNLDQIRIMPLILHAPVVSWEGIALLELWRYNYNPYEKAAKE